MPGRYLHPGVFIEEVLTRPSTICAVETSITAFIGRALRGPVNEPVRIYNYSEYEKIFGGLWLNSTMSYAVQLYFQNGGKDAEIIRVVNNAKTAILRLPPETKPLILDAANPGAWGNNLRAVVDYATDDMSDTNLFNLTVEKLDENSDIIHSEVFCNISIDKSSSRFVDNVLARDSGLVIVSTSATERPDEGTTFVADIDLASDGIVIGADQISSGHNLETEQQGIWALEKTDIFNLLNIPPFDRATDVSDITLSSALAYCKKRHAMLLIDPPMNWDSVADVLDSDTGIESMMPKDRNAAIYFPYLVIPDALQENHLMNVAPGGAVAGVFARTDISRGVWKAPAGKDASLRGISKFSIMLTDDENDQLNPSRINCLRFIPEIGQIVWGARTLVDTNPHEPEWKYIPVRRLALFIEESLYCGTKWVVFEPNDEPLWAKIRLNVGAFMDNLFHQGAFQGSSPDDAYFIKCDRETTTQDDINMGIVNTLIAFAPLKPAEFVIIKAQQIAGQIDT